MRTASSILVKTVLFIALYIPVETFAQIGCSENDLSQELVFKRKQDHISAENKKKLDSVILILNSCPSFSVALISAAVTENTSYNKLMWDRINNAGDYLFSKKVDSGRVVFNYGSEGVEYEKIFFRLLPTEGSLKDHSPHPDLFKKTAADSSKTDMPVFPDIYFKKRSVFFNKQAKKLLDSIFTAIGQYGSRKVAVVGYGSSCEACAQSSWDRTYSVMKYLEQKGIEISRFIFYYGNEGGDPLSVTVRMAAAGEEGPSMVDAPIPCYSYHHLTKRRCKNPHH